MEPVLLQQQPRRRTTTYDRLSPMEKQVYDAEQKLLEQELQRPPSLKEVFDDPLLYHIFYWHLVSRYAPENLLFRDAVKRFQNEWDLGNLPKAHKILQHIQEYYTGADSAFQVHGKKGKRKEGEAIERSMFDETLRVLEQDLARSLNALFQAEVFVAYLRHKDVLRPLTEAFLQRKQAANDGLSYTEADPLHSVRAKYGDASQLVQLRRYMEVGSPYQYVVERKPQAGQQEGQQVGWCRQEGEEFVFYDMDGQLLRRYNISTLLHAKNSPLPKPDAPAADDGVARRGGCFGSRAASPPAAPAGDKSVWYFRVPGSEQSLGPVPASDVQIWWKFHLIPAEVLCSPKGSTQFKRVDEEPFFDEGKKLQLVDPTVLSELGQTGTEI